MNIRVPPPRSLSVWEQLLIGTSWRKAHRLIPGVVLALTVMFIADRVSVWAGQVILRAQGLDPAGHVGGISAMTCSILIGLLLANVLEVRPSFRPGLEFSVRKLLRLGIILVGIKLSLVDVLRLGLWGIPVVLVVIASALILTTWFARRLGLGTRLGTLAAASTAICGVTAALAVAPTIDADDREVAYTIANVTLFGMIAMFVYPYLAHFLFAKQAGAAGLFLGTAIHDTSQVMAAALSYSQVFGDEMVMKVATMTKLTRNVFLVGVVPLLAYQAARRQGTERKHINIAKLFPLFVLGFAAMAVVRSLGDAGLGSHSARAFGFWTSDSWKVFTRTVGETISYGALGTAMAGVGLTTSLSTFRVLGLKPLYVGAMSATVVGGVALILAAVIGPRIDAYVSNHAEAKAPVAPMAAPAATVPAVNGATAPAVFEAPAPGTPSAVEPGAEPATGVRPAAAPANANPAAPAHKKKRSSALKRRSKEQSRVHL
ncbi:MAG TPA: putative sulfate exporter family transporter [Polyangia bacterium]|nr:putative sulfate exporter family transporter [Polyangia bacterium]